MPSFKEYYQKFRFDLFIRNIRRRFAKCEILPDGHANTIERCFEGAREAIGGRQSPLLLHQIVPGARLRYPSFMAYYEGRDPQDPTSMKRVDRPANSPLLTLILNQALADLSDANHKRVLDASIAVRHRKMAGAV